MNAGSSDNNIQDAAARYAADIAVPELNLSAIRLRSRSSSPSSAAVASASRLRRALLIGLPAVVTLVVILIDVPSVRARVQHVVQAFAIFNGQPVRLDVRDVSLARAQADMPFRVIPPAGFPAGLSLTVREVRAPNSPQLWRLMLEFRAPNNDMPVATIGESSARMAQSAPGREQFMIAEHGDAVPDDQAVRSQLPPPPPPSHSEEITPGSTKSMQVVAQNCNGPLPAPEGVPVAADASRPVRCFAVHPITWNDRGTRIELMPTPGTLTPAQLQMIRFAMSR
jgi:hypothetical protein